MASKPHDPTREKFRPDADARLDAEIDAALGGMSIEALIDQADNADAQPAAPGRAPAGAPRRGSYRTGKVVRVTPDDIFVDFGGKDQGVCPRQEFEEEPKVGDEIEFVIDRYNPAEGLLSLHRRGAVATGVSWESLEVGQVVEGTVTGMNKGGLEVDVKGMRAFMPAGQVEIFHVPDLSVFINQRVQAEVAQFSRQQKNLILSRRNLLERERAATREKTLAELAEGQIRRGTVRSVMDYGAFVDIGGIEGLLHVSELSFQRGRHKASDFLKQGDVLDVKVVKIDPETGKIGLSLKQARGIDPWADAAAKYAVGTTLTGRVVKVENFGVFIEVEEGIDGLLPVSEMSFSRIRHPSDMAKEGDTLKLVVIALDAANRRMTFSLKQAGPDPWKTAADRYAADMVVDGTVTRVVDFGAFVELESGMEGLVHISELSGKRVGNVADVVKPGDRVKVRVLELDLENRRASLSLKRVSEMAPAGSVSPAKPAPAGTGLAIGGEKAKKRPELRGGLDFDFKKNK